MFGSMKQTLLNSFGGKKECYHPHNDSCAICLDDFGHGEELRLLPCGHAFHRQCVDPWLLKQSELCPMCKQSIFETIDAQKQKQNDNNANNGRRFCCNLKRRRRNENENVPQNEEEEVE